MEDKRVSNRAKYILHLWNIGLFTLVWFGFYNDYTFDTYHIRGGLVSVIIYAFVYTSLCNLYKAHRIASSQIGETVFSQVISFGIADLLLYVECCLVFNRYVDIVPGVATVFLQIMGTLLIVTFTKQYLMKHIPPKKTVIIYGKKISLPEVNRFRDRLLKKYNHLFEIAEIACEKSPKEFNPEELDSYEVTILYELSCDTRGKYMNYLVERKKTFYLTPRVEDILVSGCVPRHLLDTPLAKYEYKYEQKRGYLLKRALDLVLSLTALTVLSPVLLIIALLIKIEDGGPVFFKQKRCTKDANVFEILKFRSMIVNAEEQGVTPCTENDIRITKVGRIIRKYRLDELPQLINILKGEMSIVGPRPERVEHVEQYIKEVPEFAYRMNVPAGLTGYAQIYGKYNTSAYDKLRLDMLYIETQSFILDLKLVMLTLKILFKPESTEGFEAEKSQLMNEASSRYGLGGNEVLIGKKAV